MCYYYYKRAFLNRERLSLCISLNPASVILIPALKASSLCIKLTSDSRDVLIFCKL